MSARSQDRMRRPDVPVLSHSTNCPASTARRAGDDLRVDDRDLVTERFERHKQHLRAVAYRMLGSVSEAEDALQEAWLRIRDEDPESAENMQAWLTTVVGRVCLN